MKALMTEQEMLEQALRDDARHLDEIIAIGEALGAPRDSTGSEILEVARGMVRRVEAMEFLIRHHLPSCRGCNALATRTYIHTSGNRCYVCDRDECALETFCARCHQGTRNSTIPCERCGYRAHNWRTTVWTITDLPFAEVLRRAGVTRE